MPKATDPRVEKRVAKYYDECMKSNKGRTEYCASVAWSIFCSHVNTQEGYNYDGCTKAGKKWGPSDNKNTSRGASCTPCEMASRLHDLAERLDASGQQDLAGRVRDCID